VLRLLAFQLPQNEVYVARTVQLVSEQA